MRKHRLFCLLISLISVLSMFSACSDNRTSGIAMKVDGVEISKVQFQIFFASAVQSRLSSASSDESVSVPDLTKSLDSQQCTVEGSTDKNWAEYFTEYTVDYCREVYSVYAKATAEGISVDDTYVSEQMENLKSTVAEAVEDGEAKSEEKYLESVFGDNVSYDDLTEYFKVLSVYETYHESVSEKTEFEKDELDKYYSDNRDMFDRYTVRLAYFNTDSLTSGLNIDELDMDGFTPKTAAEYFVKNYTSSETDFAEGYTYNFMTQEMLVTYGTADITRTYNFNSEFFDEYDAEFNGWLNDESRKYGDVYTIDTGDMGTYFVIMYLEKDLHDYNLVNFYEMLVETDKKDEVDSKWEASDKSREAFTTLVKEYTTDTNAENDEGYFGDIYNGYSKYTEINKWLFDEKHTEGDFKSFETSSGYVYIFFDSYGQNYRDKLIRKAYFEEYYSNLVKEIMNSADVSDKDVADIWKNIPVREE